MDKQLPPLQRVSSKLHLEFAPASPTAAAKAVPPVERLTEEVSFLKRALAENNERALDGFTERLRALFAASASGSPLPAPAVSGTAAPEAACSPARAGGSRGPPPPLPPPPLSPTRRPNSPGKKEGGAREARLAGRAGPNSCSVEAPLPPKPPPELLEGSPPAPRGAPRTLEDEETEGPDLEPPAPLRLVNTKTAASENEGGPLMRRLTVELESLARNGLDALSSQTGDALSGASPGSPPTTQPSSPLRSPSPSIGGAGAGGCLPAAATPASPPPSPPRTQSPAPQPPSEPSPKWQEDARGNGEVAKAYAKAAASGATSSARDSKDVVSPPRERVVAIPGAVTQHLDALQEQPKLLNGVSFCSRDMENGLSRDSMTSTLTGLQGRKTTLSSMSSEEEGTPTKGGQRGLFSNLEAMKEQVRQTIHTKPYSVTDYYKEDGIFRRIAMSPIFENFTLLVIVFNAIWIAVDTDLNSESVLIRAKLQFQVAENFFCFYFSFEWIVRFFAFENKRNTLKDPWFVFDSALLAFMVLETWILSIALIVSGGTNAQIDLGVVGLFRLLRLARIARISRLMRAVPELMVLVKGMLAATKSVFWTLFLLIVMMYVFAICFTQLAEDTEIGKTYFPTVWISMQNLLLDGTLPDNAAMVVAVGEESWVYALLLLLFILLGSLTVLNMLVGVLCETMSTVSSVEKETSDVKFVKDQMLDILRKNVDADGDMMVSKDEFEALLVNPAAAKAIDFVGVDVESLVECSDFIFRHKGQGLTFGDFVEIVLDFRGSKVATVKDIIGLKRHMLMELSSWAKILDKRFDRTFQKGMKDFGDHSTSTRPTSTEDPASPTA
eukprot:TRINITY_DN10550_c1_g1_i2.p1 TRINITY_DN10550_c1_g1~~TRINITY_DN10550_c1_g1_i2.p1  ORF type:complete len:857 (-),score=155.79 TRINITY_DN10550_c1_g1_i2:168-2681(-)